MDIECTKYSPKVKYLEKCFLCGKKIQMGPHLYEGHICKGYGFLVCDICWRGNWDGWAPYYEAKILEFLKENNIKEVERLPNGLLPRELPR